MFLKLDIFPIQVTKNAKIKTRHGSNYGNAKKKINAMKEAKKKLHAEGRVV